MPTPLVLIRRCGRTLFAGGLAAALLAAALVPDAGHAATADEAEKTCRERYYRGADRSTEWRKYNRIQQLTRSRNKAEKAPMIYEAAVQMKRAVSSASLLRRQPVRDGGELPFLPSVAGPLPA